MFPLKKLLIKVRKKIFNVTRVNWLLIKRGWSLFRWSIFTPIVSGAIGIALQISALGLIFGYVKLLVSGKEITKYGFNVQPRESLGLLGLFALSCLVLMLVSALATYFYNSRVIKLSTDLEMDLVGNLIKTLKQAPVIRIPTIDGVKHLPAVIKILLADSRACGRAFILSLTAVIPFVTFLVGAVAVFYMNWVVTIMLLPLVLLYLVAIYRVNSFGIKSSRDLEKAVPIVRDKIRGILDAIRVDDQGLKIEEEVVALQDEHKLRDYLNSYGGLVRLGHRSSFINDVLIGISISIIFFGLSAKAVISETNWQSIAAYLVALRYVTNYLKQVSNKVTVMNRFYPQASRYFFFLDLLKGGVDPTNSTRISTAPASCILGEKVVWVIKPRGVDKFEIANMVELLVPNSDNSGCRVLFSPTADEVSDVMSSEGLNRVFINVASSDEAVALISPLKKSKVLHGFLVVKEVVMPPSEDLPVVVVNDDEVVWSGTSEEVESQKDYIRSLLSKGKGVNESVDEADLLVSF